MGRGRPKEPSRTPITVTVLPKTVERLDKLVDKRNPQRYSKGKVVDEAIMALK